jgi:hypothetical protein
MVKAGVNTGLLFGGTGNRVILKTTFPLQFNVTLSHQAPSAEMRFLIRPCNFGGLLFDA